MKNRGRTAAKVTGVVASAALVFGVMGPAGAAPQDVVYRLVPDSGKINLPTPDGVVEFGLPEATGVSGTWDDETGDFTGTFSSAEYASSRAVTPAVTANQRIQLLAPGGVTGNIDPETGAGSVSATFNVNIFVDSLTSAAPPVAVNAACTITGVVVTYTVAATKVPADSLNYTNLALTSAAAFNVPASECVPQPGQPAGALPMATVKGGLDTALALPNAGATSSLQLIAGAVPPPPSTTTTTLPPTTTTSTTAAPAEEAPAATPVGARARFTG